MNMLDLIKWNAFWKKLKYLQEKEILNYKIANLKIFFIIKLLMILFLLQFKTSLIINVQIAFRHRANHNLIAKNYIRNKTNHSRNLKISQEGE
jgi:hypothetical protein